MNTHDAFAQACSGSEFISAHVSENSSICGGISTVSSVLHTGYDSRYDGGNHTTLSLVVNLWDGDYPGLSWNDGTNICSIALPSGIVDPDVVLVEDQNTSTWYALVVYSISGACTYAPYIYSSGSFSALSTTTLGVYSTAINIDADADGNFAIIWDDALIGDIELQTGKTYSGSGPSLCGSSAHVPNTNHDGMWPDVAINHVYSDFFILYTYVNAAQDHLHVGFEGNYSGLCVPTIMGYVSNYTLLNEDISYNSNLKFWHPRIACPNGVNNSIYSKERSVVVELQDASGPYCDIVSFTTTSSTSSYKAIYTDGGTDSPCDINASANYYPAVTYDDSYNGIMVGWESDYTGPSGSFYPKSCLAVECKRDGSYNGNGYLIVPSDNINSPNTTVETSLSLSGRENGDGSDNIQYSFYNENTTDLQYKLVPFGNSTLRSKRPVESTQSSVTIAPNPFTDDLTIHLTEPDAQVHLSIRSTMGKILMDFSGNEAQINKQLHEFAETLSSGVYLLNMDYSGQITTEKLVKM